MPKSPGDEIGARETWIQERLGERKYRQLRMHLTGALRLLNELGVWLRRSKTRPIRRSESDPLAGPLFYAE